MADQRITSQIEGLLAKMLGKGIVVSGEIKIEGLTITSVEKAQEMGLLDVSEEESQEGVEDVYSPGEEDQHDILNNEVVSRDEFNRMAEEISSLRNVILSGSQGKSLGHHRGRPSKRTKRD